jgi:16S rRNA G966 N2-methylase RsmD
MYNRNKIFNVYLDKAKEIFPEIDDENKIKLLMTTEAKYSVSKVIGSEKLVELIKQMLNNTNITITDTTANVGSDSIQLGLHFKKVNSIEFDDINFKALKNNVTIFKKIYKDLDINVIHGNSLNYLDNLEQDVIYMDPPWREAGENKENWKELYLIKDNKEEIILPEIYKKYKNYCKLFVFKLPPEYDFENFIKETKIKEENYKIIDIKRNDIIIFRFIAIKNIKEQEGGFDNIYYYKYLKYKEKYLELKKLLF